MEQTVLTAISAVGFPIVVTFYFLTRFGHVHGRTPTAHRRTASEEPADSMITTCVDTDFSSAPRRPFFVHFFRETPNCTSSEKGAEGQYTFQQAETLFFLTTTGAMSEKIAAPFVAESSIYVIP